MHSEERQWIKDNAARYAAQKGISIDQAIGDLTAQADRQVQNGSQGAWDPSASSFLGLAHGMLPPDGNSGPGYMFYATPDQKANPDIYGKYYLSEAGMNVPGSQAILDSANREQAYRDAYGKLTWAAAAGATGIAVVAPIAALPGVPIFSTDGVLGTGALASPVGTGAISAGINAGSQYLQNGSINPIDLAGAFGTGVAGSYGGLLWNIGANAFGGATTTTLNNILQGKNDSVIGAGVASGLFSSIGYGAGKVASDSINSIMKPTINNSASWANSGAWNGSGYNIFCRTTLRQLVRHP